jgi:hypothetical protein
MNAPGAGTAPFSLNFFGAVAGAYYDSSFAAHGFVRLHNGEVATFHAPHAGTVAGQGTHPSTNNASDQVTGWWIDETGLNHGFVWCPVDN